MKATYLLQALGLILAVSLSTLTQAHDDKWLDQQVAPNGGQLRMAGLYHLELVVKADSVHMYLSDHAGQAQDAAGTSVDLTLLANKKAQKAKLTPSGKSVLMAKGQFPTNEDLQVIAVLNVPNQAPVSAKFTPFRKMTPTETTKDHHEHDHSHEKPEHSHSHDNAHKH